MIYILHVHRDDMPNRCFWLQADDGTLCAHPAMAREFSKFEEAYNFATAMAPRVIARCGCDVTIIVDMVGPDTIPLHIRALVRLDN